MVQGKRTQLASAFSGSLSQKTALLCQERGMYIHAPDPFYMRGINKDGMGYVETNWNLPRCAARLPPLLSHPLMPPDPEGLAW